MILFPEGARGEPETLGRLHSGVALLVPFCCDVVVGEALAWNRDRRRFMGFLEERLAGLLAELPASPWE